MTDYKIFLYTKFSVPCFPLRKSYPTKALKCDVSSYDKYIAYLYSSNRMLSRLFFFENITVPSIVSQTYKNFEWIIFVHKNLPQYYYDQIQQINKKYNNIFNLIQVDHESLQNKNLLKYHEPEESEYISIRLDDDDGLHNTYFMLVNEAFNNPNIDICGSRRCLLISKDDESMYYRTDYKNYLISCGLSAKNHNIFTCGSHTKVHKKYKYLDLNNNNLCVMSCGEHTITRRSTSLTKKFDMTLYLTGHRYE